jgi:uncharacterized protein YkwD
VTRSATIAVIAVAGALAGLGGGASGAAAACPGAGDAGAGAAAQERAMLCLVNGARRQRGLRPLVTVSALRRAGRRKSADLLRCDEFSHQACGRQFTYWMSRFGYRGCREGENIAWGSGGYATPRAIFELWMHSAGHRENILGPYRDTGIGLRVGTLEGNPGAHVWTEEFGSRSC